MSKLKVAILEDSPILLKDLKENLEETGLIEVITWATNSEEFLAKAEKTKPEALILDIDLNGDSMNGIDVANKLKLPVLFCSGKTRDYIQGIENLDSNFTIPVFHISKPITTEKLEKILPKFINQTNNYRKTKFVYLDFAKTKRNKIPVDSIVFIETETGNSGKSNNKRIYFKDRKPETLFNIALEKINELGLDKTKFIKIRSSHRVNAELIICYNTDHQVKVEVFNTLGKLEIKKLAVSENYRKEVVKTIRK